MVRTLKPLAILLLASGLAPVAAFPQDRNCSSNAVVVNGRQTPDGDSIKLNKIIFTGTPALSTSDQEDISAVLSKAAFKSRHEMNEELRSLVRDQWQQRGYFKIEVGEPEITTDDEDRSLLTAIIWVEAGNQYRLGKLRLVKNTAFPAETLRSLFPIQTGDVFNTHKVGKGIEELRKLYGEIGYINMSVVPTTEQQEDENRVNLTMELDEGKPISRGQS